MPGYKITMLPDAVVQRFTLSEGRDSPALSLYVQFDEATLERGHFETRIERVHVSDNLRHDQLDGVVTEASLRGGEAADYRPRSGTRLPVPPGQSTEGQRESVRGKPETFNRPDYNFRLEGVDGQRARAATRTCRSHRGCAARRWT